jgi:hypothetical protein
MIAAHCPTVPAEGRCTFMQSMRASSSIGPFMPLKRVAALLSGLLLLQLALLSSGVLCGPHRDGQATTSMTSMTSMASMSSVSRIGDASRPADSDGDCDAQPAVRCAAMASCTLEIAPSVMIAAVGATVSANRLPEPIALRAERSVVPDVPPPRA